MSCSSGDDLNKGYVWKQVKLFEQKDNEFQMDSQRNRKAKGAPSKTGRNQNTSQKLKEALTIKRPNKNKTNPDNNKNPVMERNKTRSTLPKSKSLHNSSADKKDCKRQNSLVTDYSDFEQEKKKVLEEIELNNDIVEQFGEKLRQRRLSARAQDEPNNTIENLPLVKTKNSISRKDDDQAKIDQPSTSSKLKRGSVIKEETFVLDNKPIYRKTGSSSMKSKVSDSKTKSKCADFKRHYSSPGKIKQTKVKSCEKLVAKTEPNEDCVKSAKLVQNRIKMFDDQSLNDIDKNTLSRQMSFESEIEKKITDSLENLDNIDNQNSSNDQSKDLEEVRKSANFEIDQSLEQIRLSCQELDNLSYDTPISSRKPKSKFDEYLEKRASAYPRMETEPYQSKREEYDFGDSTFSDPDYYIEAHNLTTEYVEFEKEKKKLMEQTGFNNDTMEKFEDHLPDSELIMVEIQITKKRLSSWIEDDQKSIRTSSRLESVSESGSDLVFTVESETESLKVFVEEDFRDFNLNTESKYDSGIANSTESVHTYESLTEFNKQTSRDEYVDLKRSKSLSHLEEDNSSDIYVNLSEVRQNDIKDSHQENNRMEGTISRQESTTKKPKLNYIIDELKTSEYQYLSGLRKIVHDYIPYITEKTPKHLVGKTCYLFGNIKYIYREEKIFYEDLLKCDADPAKIANVFLDHASLFKQYPIYFKNKPTANILLKDFHKVLKEAQFRFNDKLELSAHLLTPIQRLGKLILFLQNIASELEKIRRPNMQILEALTLVKSEMMRGNDQIAIDSIINCPIPLEQYGPFRTRDTFQCVKPKRGTMVLFLFENIIILTVPSPKNSEQYQYEDSILFSDLLVKLGEEDTAEIELYNFAKSKKGQEKHCYQLIAKNVKVKYEWWAVIETKLWQQADEVKKNVQMLYSSRSDANRTSLRHYTRNEGEKNNKRRLKSSTFYVNPNE